MNMRPYAPELRVDFENQAPISRPERVIEVRETLYESRQTTWYEYVPSGYAPGTPVPLVLQMHGGGGDGLSEAMYSDWHRVAEKNTFIVAYPNSHSYGRWECDEADIETICRLIERLCARYTIDRTRIYMQGMSNGEMITTAFVLAHPELLAAAGFIAGPLPGDMLPHMPKEPFPCIQIRGEKDVHFPHRQYDRNDVYAPKSQMNDFNRRMWMEINQTDAAPQMLIRGRDNLFLYRGPVCDLIYWEVKDLGHRCPPHTAEAFWDYCYSGWANDGGRRIRHEPKREFPAAEDQGAVAVGGKGVWRCGRVMPFTTGGAADCLLVHPARTETDPYYDIGESLLTSAVYAPIEALSLMTGYAWQVEENGCAAVLRTPEGRQYRFLKDSWAVFDGETLCAMQKPCFYRFGLFFVPVIEAAAMMGFYASESDGVILLSPRPCHLSKGAARIIAHLLDAPAAYPEPEIPKPDCKEAMPCSR